MPGSILGNAVRRVEDPDLLTGASTYVDDLRAARRAAPGVRAQPVAHARILGIDTARGRGLPGVVAVCTAADLDLPAATACSSTSTSQSPGRRWPPTRSASSAIRSPWSSPRPGPRPSTRPSWSTSTTTRCRRSSTCEAALAARRAAAVRASSAPTSPPALRDPRRADRSRAPTSSCGRRIENQRIAVVPMEGNAIAGDPGRRRRPGHELTVYVSTQMPHGCARLAGARSSASTRTSARDRARTSAARSAARPVCPPSTPWPSASRAAGSAAR